MSSNSGNVAGAADKSRFATTQWSVVLAAGGGPGDDARRALTELCETYWYPLYVYVRRSVSGTHEAQDLTQAFFSHLIEKDAIARAQPDRGRFRAFLLTSLKNFLSNERDKARAWKRGGGKPLLSLDFDSAESRFQIEPAHELTPDKLFERRWVMTLLNQVLERLHAELTAAGRQTEFEQLKDSLAGEATAEHYQRAASQLGITPAAAKQAAYRLRKRYRQLFRAEVARTIASDEDVDDEIGRLLEYLG